MGTEEELQCQGWKRRKGGDAEVENGRVAAMSKLGTGDWERCLSWQ